jgi:DNA-binding LytR/AlgR family response regulator
MQLDYQKKRLRPLPEYISVISGKKCAKIKIDDIELIEQNGRKLHVITPRSDYEFYGTLNTMAEVLCERAFFRPMKTLIINLDQVSDITGYTVNFYSGQTLTIGKNALNNIKKAFKKYLLRYPPYTIWEPLMVSQSYVGDIDSGFDKEEDSKDTNNGNDHGKMLLN